MIGRRYQLRRGGFLDYGVDEASQNSRKSVEPVKDEDEVHDDDNSEDNESEQDNNNAKDNSESADDSEVDEDNEEDDEGEEDEDNGEEDDDEVDVLMMIAKNVVLSFKKDLKEYKIKGAAENDSDNDDSEGEDASTCGSNNDEAFTELKSKLRRCFYHKFVTYSEMFRKWGDDPIIKLIIKRKRAFDDAFTEEEAVRSSLDKHKQVIYSRLKDAINDYLQTRDGVNEEE